MTDTLAGLGGEVSGGAFVHRGERLRDRPFASITDLPQEHVPLASLPDLHRLFDHPDVRVVQVRMQNGTSATSDAAEFVGYEGISA
ncbi:MAG TPA: hypothetical protein VJZ00_15755, partial [Thermoanaerobaculia bacterium]|nr:hypothetical protein [Thermoanaerobaculia bacterium]